MLGEQCKSAQQRVSVLQAKRAEIERAEEERRMEEAVGNTWFMAKQLDGVLVIMIAVLEGVQGLRRVYFPDSCLAQLLIMETRDCSLPLSTCKHCRLPCCCVCLPDLFRTVLF